MFRKVCEIYMLLTFSRKDYGHAANFKMYGGKLHC